MKSGTQWLKRESQAPVAAGIMVLVTHVIIMGSLMRDALAPAMTP